MGTFLDGLNRQGIEVVVVFSADHGELDFAERLRSQGVPARRVDTKAWLTELRGRVKAELRTSESIVGGGDQQIFIEQAPASTVDIAPTLAKELGIMPEEKLDGVPLILQPK